MTNDSSAAMFASGMAWLEQHRQSYLRSGGAEGHIIDLSSNGGRAFATHCLLRYVGRKSGKTYINPVLYGVFGGEVVVVASKGGADHHPAWYLNVTAGNNVEFQIATQAFSGIWRQPEGEERDGIWDFMVGLHPPFASYQRSTSRRIPIALLTATGQLPVFTESDIS